MSLSLLGSCGNDSSFPHALYPLFALDTFHELPTPLREAIWQVCSATPDQEALLDYNRVDAFTAELETLARRIQSAIQQAKDDGRELARPRFTGWRVIAEAELRAEENKAQRDGHPDPLDGPMITADVIAEAQQLAEQRRQEPAVRRSREVAEPRLWSELVILKGPNDAPVVLGRLKPKKLSKSGYRLLKALLDAGEDGLSWSDVRKICGDYRGILERLKDDPDWAAILYSPGKKGGGNYRIGFPSTRR